MSERQVDEAALQRAKKLALVTLFYGACSDLIEFTTRAAFKEAAEYVGMDSALLERLHDVLIDLYFESSSNAKERTP